MMDEGHLSEWLCYDGSGFAIKVNSASSALPALHSRGRREGGSLQTLAMVACVCNPSS